MAEDYPKTVSELEQRFASEAACWEYLCELRWPEGFVCPRCQSAQAWRMGRGLWLCRQCRHQVSVKAGTIFHDSRLPLRVWFRLMWHVISQKHGVSALGLQRALGLGSYETAWTCLHKLRRAMVRPGRDRLSGAVDVDETYVGGERPGKRGRGAACGLDAPIGSRGERPGKRGRGAAGKSLVVIAAQHEAAAIGRIRLVRVADAAGSHLERAIVQSVEPGSVVRTDGWSGYAGVRALGYVHQVVGPAAALGENLLPRCHRVASLLKRWLLGTHQGAVRSNQLEYYLDEFTFRFNRRHSRHRGKLFYRLAQQAVQIDPVPYARIVRPQPVGAS